MFLIGADVSLATWAPIVVSITSGDMTKNQSNTIMATVTQAFGTADPNEVNITIESPAGTTKVNFQKMSCSGDGYSLSCSYSVTLGCDWASDAKIRVDAYDPPIESWYGSATNTVNVGVPLEICHNSIDDDCDGQTDCADSDCACEPSCDAIIDGVNLSRSPLNTVYDVNTITFSSTAWDDCGIQNHKIKYWVNGALHSPVDEWPTGGTHFITIGPYSAGTLIEYQATATDNNFNYTATSKESFIVVECHPPGSTQSQSCGNCGTQDRICQANGIWGAWDSCTGEGVCSPGANQGCGDCGSQICQVDCIWGSCAGEGVCSPGATKDCNGGCGQQTCSSSCVWGACDNDCPYIELGSQTIQYQVYCGIGSGVGLIGFKWTYKDTDGDTESRFDFRVNNINNVNDLSPEVDKSFDGLSNPDGSDNSQAIIVMSPIVEDKITYNTIYYWWVKVFDSKGADSGWKAGPSFFTDAHASPWPDFTLEPDPPVVDVSIQLCAVEELGLCDLDVSVCYDINNEEVSCSGGTFFWDISDCDGIFVGGTSETFENPKVKLFSSGEIILSIIDKDGFGPCVISKDIEPKLPYPDWKEIPPH